MSRSKEAEEIARGIKEGLSLKKMKQKDLAAIMGKSNALVSEWISGRKIPRGDDLIRIINLLEISHLFFENKSKKEETGEKTRKIRKLQKEMVSLQKRFDDIEKKIAQ